MASSRENGINLSQPERQKNNIKQRNPEEHDLPSCPAHLQHPPKAAAVIPRGKGSIPAQSMCPDAFYCCSPMEFCAQRWVWGLPSAFLLISTFISHPCIPGCRHLAVSAQNEAPLALFGASQEHSGGEQLVLSQDICLWINFWDEMPQDPAKSAPNRPLFPAHPIYG